jgi:alpha-tubulin suppressor-like RCC1 family protein
MRKRIILMVLGLLAAVSSYAQPAMAATTFPATTVQPCCTNVYYDGASGARAWGQNGNGQLGDGTTTDRNTPVTVNNLSGVKTLATGWYHSLALKEDGTVWAWGDNYYGQLGNGTNGLNAKSSTPVRVSNLSGGQAIAAGGYHSLATVATQPTAYCCLY